MNTPVPENHCPECGAPLTPGSAQGLCARCLLAGAAAPTEPTTSRSTPPALEQVAAAFPQFEVLELIGHGGMGAVFKVRQPKLARFAALKLLPQSLAADPAFASRFEREAQLLARLNHANIVTVYDHGQAGEFFYLLMEYVDGVNLRQAMRASRFTPQQALGIVPKICEALQYAHDEGVLHRDIKPENILLDAKGRVKLADFGIAKLTAEPDASLAPSDANDPKLTNAGAALGTPQYMAPEQRDNPGDVDHRADIYSLGVVFYELLTGELPIGKFVPPSEISAADPRVDAIVQQALQKERERRQHSASEMKTQVETLGGAAGASASSAAAPAPAASVRAMVAAPAIAMMIASALGILGTVFVGLIVALLAVSGPSLAQSPFISRIPFPLGRVGAVDVSLLFLLALLGLAGSAFVFFAGWRMRTLRNRNLAIAGSVVLIVTALLTLPSKTPAWSMLEVAVGIWALVILLRPEVSAAFASAPAVPAGETTDARSLVAVPAGGLMVASGFNLLLFAVGLFCLLFFVGVGHTPSADIVSVSGPGISVTQTTSPPKMAQGVSVFSLTGIVLVFTIIPSILTFIGAARMRQLRGYGLAITAAILGIVTPPGMIIGVIFGIWALVVLSRGDVRAAFDNGAARSSGRGCLIAAAAVLGVPLLLGLGLIGLKTSAFRSSGEIFAAEVHCRVFEADAARVQELVPGPTRLPGEMQDSELQYPKTKMAGSPLTVASQTAELSADALGQLLPDASAKPGILVDKRRNISGWPVVADTWIHTWRNNELGGTVSGSGFLGVRSTQGVVQFRPEYRVTYQRNQGESMSAQIAWEGPAPHPGSSRVFFLPFTGTDGKARYLVIAFEVGPASPGIVALPQWIQGDWVFDPDYSREKMRFRNPNDANNPASQAAVKVMFDGYEKMRWTITPTEMQSHHADSGTQSGPYHIVRVLGPNAIELEISDSGATKRLIFRREGERLLLEDTGPKPEAIPFELPAYYKRATTPAAR